MRARRRLRPFVLTAAVAALALPGSAAADDAGNVTASGGAVQATLSWEKAELGVKNPRLVVVRAGATLYDGSPVGDPDTCLVGCVFAGTGADAPLQVLDLDGDGEPEVVVDTYSGGAHCCTITPIYRWTGSGYRRLTGFFGNVGYSLDDLDHDGRPEFVTADDSFAYEFAAYAFSAFPLLVLEYGTDRSGRTALRDVTAGYSGLVEDELAGFRKDIPKYRKDGDPRSVIAAYVADLYRLGRKRQADAYLNSALRRGLLRSPDRFDIWPANRKYIRDLKRFLKKHGYSG
jgi:hypothetical protein